MAEALELPPVVEPDFDWKNPDYTTVFKQRAERLDRLRDDAKLMQAVKIHYRYHPWDFIHDWGMTFDPRNVDIQRLPSLPFIPFKRQIEYLQWIYRMWRGRERGQCEKSRECGVSWLTVALGCTLWCFEPGFVCGFGSRKQEYVDDKDNPKSLFYMARFFLNHLPDDFLPHTWSSPKNRIVNDDTGAALIGEAGDDIGRGGRTSMYIVDEAAFVTHQLAVDMALSNTTNCQIDISSFSGSGNEFFKKNQRLKMRSPQKLFIFDWRQDPRKDQAWYDKKCEEFDEIIVAQEIDRNPFASQTDSFIPAKWVAASLDAHKKLGFEPTGLRAAGFDPADVGDAKGMVVRHGSVLIQCEELHQGDITYALPWSFNIAEEHRAEVYAYDGDGMGAPVMRTYLMNAKVRGMDIQAYHGSAAVEDPKDKFGKSEHDARKTDDLKTNADAFLNYRAQTWWWLRERFHRTFVAVERAKAGQIVNFDPDDLISIDTERCKDWQALQAELSSPKRKPNNNGKIQVESKPQMKAREVKSPNLADAVVIAYSRRRPKVETNQPWRGSRTTRRYADRGAGY